MSTANDNAEMSKQIEYLARALKAPRIREAAARLADHARDAGSGETQLRNPDQTRVAGGGPNPANDLPMCDCFPWVSQQPDSWQAVDSATAWRRSSATPKRVPTSLSPFRSISTRRLHVPRSAPLDDQTAVAVRPYGAQIPE